MNTVCDEKVDILVSLSEHLAALWSLQTSLISTTGIGTKFGISEISH
jgi:hypothetical protein